VRGLAKVGLVGIALAIAAWLMRRASAPAPAEAPQPQPQPQPQPESPAPTAEAVDGYCMKERKKVPIANPEPAVSKDGRSAVRGTCPDCGAKIFRFV
jgi:hypothetical protein